MQYKKLFTIHLSHIQVFLTAAQYGSFTAAAERHYMTQPMVSKIITGLEQEMGIILFVRTHGKLQITPAGLPLKRDWESILTQFEHSLEKAHLLQEGREEILRIGLAELGLTSCAEYTDIIKRVRGIYPRLRIEMETNHMLELIRKLRKNECDVAIMSQHLLPEIENMHLNWKTIQETLLSVFVHKSNPLAEREQISFADLRTEKFIAFLPEYDPSYFRLLFKLAEEHSFKPRISCYVTNALSLQTNLMLGNGIVLADSASGLENEEIRRFDLEGYPNNVMAVWKGTNNKKGLLELLELL